MIVGEPAPTYFEYALELLQVAFDDVPVHVQPPSFRTSTVPNALPLDSTAPPNGTDRGVPVLRRHTRTTIQTERHCSGAFML
jgi:hypothetical protein